MNDRELNAYSGTRNAQTLNLYRPVKRLEWEALSQRADLAQLTDPADSENFAKVGCRMRENCCRDDRSGVEASRRVVVEACNGEFWPQMVANAKTRRKPKPRPRL